MAVWVFTITLPPDTDTEEFGGRFAAIDMEGLEERAAELCIYVNDTQLEAGEPYINSLCEQLQLEYTKTPLEQKNWNEAWEKHFQPVQVEDFVYIRAGFHPHNDGAKHEIVIDPKMSFGTGHHPTTWQVMRSMEFMAMDGKRVLDCGSGTGILAILAEKCGAGQVVALDNDAWCYTNVQENIALNGSEKIVPVMGELQGLADTDFHVILANIHRNYLLENMELLAEKLVKKGKIVMSGFYGKDALVILQKALEYNLIAHYYSQQHHWACLVLEKR